MSEHTPASHDPEWESFVAGRSVWGEDPRTATAYLPEIPPMPTAPPAAPVVQPLAAHQAPAFGIERPPLHGVVLPPAMTGAPVPRRTVVERAREWVVSRTGIQTAAVSLGLPSAVWVLAEMSADSAPIITGASGALLLVGGSTLGVASLSKHWGNGAVVTGLGAAVLGLQVGMSTAPSPLAGFIGWVLGVAGAASARVAYANGRRKPEAELRILAAEAAKREAAVITEHMKAQAQAQKAQLNAQRAFLAAAKADAELRKAMPAPVVAHGLSYAPTLRGDETAVEAALLHVLTPGAWADAAPGRGLDGTSVIGSRLTDSGVEARIRLDGRWDPPKLAAQEGQIRALASIATATRVQVGPSDWGDVAKILVRTRSASDGMTTEWTPGRQGVGIVVATGEILDVPVEGAHSMTGGRTNMGKSAYARIQLMRTVSDPKRAGVVIDPKRAEAVAWAGKLRTAGEAADLEERYLEIYNLLRELMAEFRHRQTLFPGLYWEASEEYPTLFITIDEGAAIKRMSEYEKVDAEGKKYKPYEDSLDIAETLYGEARVVGMWFNWASQYLAKGTSIPQLVKENVGATVGLTTLGAEGDRMLFGEEAGKKGWSPSEHCKGIPGRAMVKYLGSEPEPVQLWHVTGDHIAALPDVEPWRSKAPGAWALQRPAAPAPLVPADPEESLTANQRAVLDAIRAGHAGPADIERITRINRGSVKRAMDRLEELGLI
jgi:hypothetical protein